MHYDVYINCFYFFLYSMGSCSPLFVQIFIDSVCKSKKFCLPFYCHVFGLDFLQVIRGWCYDWCLCRDTSCLHSPHLRILITSFVWFNILKKASCQNASERKLPTLKWVICYSVSFCFSMFSLQMCHEEEGDLCFRRKDSVSVTQKLFFWFSTDKSCG